MRSNLKGTVGTIVVMFLLSYSLCINSFAAEDIAVKLNEQLVNFDVQPKMINYRVMVPFRAIFEKLDAKLEWNEATQRVKAFTSDKTLVLTIGDRTATINGEIKGFDVAPTIIDDRTLVPVRFISEALGSKVSWDDAMLL